MHRLVLRRQPSFPSPRDTDAWARVVALVAAWPAGEPVQPFVERRFWRATARGELRETVILGLHDELRVLDPTAGAAELMELARPLRGTFPLTTARRDEEQRMDALDVSHVAELGGLDAVIPEGPGALAGLFEELLGGLAALRGAVSLGLLIAPASDRAPQGTEGAWDPRGGQGEDPRDDRAGTASWRALDARLRLATATPLPMALRARAESVCVARRPDLRSWELAAGPAEVGRLAHAVATHRPGSSRPARADVRTAAITLALPPTLRPAGVVLGTPVAGALPTDGPIIGAVPRVRGGMARWRLGWDARARHVALFGGTGSGKSTTLERLILGDLEAGRGVVVLDPHGDLGPAISTVLSGRAGTVAIDPREAESSPLDLLHPRPEVCAGLITSAMAELWPPEFSGPMFSQQISVALRVLAAAGEPLTIVALHRWFTDSAWRQMLLHRLSEKARAGVESSVATLDRPSRDDNSVAEWVASKFAPLATGTARALFDRPSELTWESRVARGDAVVVSLPTGMLSSASTRMIGRMLVTRISAALAAQGRLRASERRPFSIVIDEAHLVAGPALAGLFAEVRKFGGSVVVATQTPQQLEPHLDLVLSNVGTVISGRLTRRAAAPLRERAGDAGVAALSGLPRRHLMMLDEEPTDAVTVLAPVGLPDREPAGQAVARRAANIEPDAARTVDRPARRGEAPDRDEMDALSFVEEWLERRSALDEVTEPPSAPGEVDEAGAEPRLVT